MQFSFYVFVFAGVDVQRRELDIAAPAGDAEHAGGHHGRRAGGQGEGVVGARHVAAEPVRPAVVGPVPPVVRGAAEGPAGVPAGERVAPRHQPVPVLRVPERPEARDAGVLPVPAQRGSGRPRDRDQVHEHVRRSGEVWFPFSVLSSCFSFLGSGPGCESSLSAHICRHHLFFLSTFFCTCAVLRVCV